jgi:release factor glutamine methyltransferase
MNGPSVRDILKKSEAFLAERGVDSPRLSAELLLAETLGLDRLHLFLDLDRPLAGDELDRARGLLARRGRGEPVALILGRKEFFGLEFGVSRDVLVPRPETEQLLEEAQARLPKDAAFLAADLGTGSGCLAVGLAVLFPRARVAAVDVSSAALAVARDNAARHGVLERVLLARGDAGRCPLADASCLLALANPPYVNARDYERLSPEVRDFEPQLALLGGADGLDQVRAQAPEMARLLAPGGWGFMEIGWDQGAAALEIFQAQAAFSQAAVLRDLAGLERVVAVQRG